VQRTIRQLVLAAMVALPSSAAIAQCTVIEEHPGYRRANGSYAPPYTRTRDGTDSECRSAGLEGPSGGRKSNDNRGNSPGTRSFTVALPVGTSQGTFVDGSTFLLRDLPRITGGSFIYTDTAGRLVAVPLREVKAVDTSQRRPCVTCKRDAQGRIVPNLAARAAFLATHPCPTGGGGGGACLGYVVDHATPLACGGEDAPENMQWQTEGQVRIKEEWVGKACGG
jgi:hypothetical protein